MSNVRVGGIYIIWFTSQPGVRNTVRLGKGDVADRVREHRNNPVITAYRQNGQLLVTWATVPEAQRDGVERYLADTLNPLVGDAFPDVVPLVVNLPA